MIFIRSTFSRSRHLLFSEWYRSKGWATFPFGTMGIFAPELGRAPPPRPLEQPILGRVNWVTAISSKPKRRGSRQVRDTSDTRVCHVLQGSNQLDRHRVRDSIPRGRPPPVRHAGAAYFCCPKPIAGTLAQEGQCHIDYPRFPPLGLCSAENRVMSNSPAAYLSKSVANLAVTTGDVGRPSGLLSKISTANWSRPSFVGSSPAVPIRKE